MRVNRLKLNPDKTGYISTKLDTRRKHFGWLLAVSMSNPVLLAPKDVVCCSVGLRLLLCPEKEQPGPGEDMRDPWALFDMLSA